MAAPPTAPPPSRAPPPPERFPPPQPSPRAALHRASLDRFLDDAAVRGERSVARLRLAFCTLGLLNLFLLANAGQRLAQGSPKAWVQVTLLVGACLASGWFLKASEERRRPAWFLEGSVLADAFLLLGVVGVSVYWPSESYRGFLSMPISSAFPLALACAGFRLSGRAVKTAGFFNLSSAFGLVLYDFAVNPQAAATPRDDVGIYVVLNAMGLLVAIAIVQRTRRLVTDGAGAALDAERARQRLGVYVSQQVADAALAAEELGVGGEHRYVTVLFSDLRGFTRYGEALPPERLVGELNAYLDAMIAVVREEGGVVDKYIGDAIMVVFGIPASRSDDAARAIRTAWRMQVALERHNEDRASRGLIPLAQGVGVHFGQVIAGNIGTPERLQYTVIGDTVNIASRLEAATKETGTAVLVSAEAVEAARGHLDPDIPLVPAGTLQIRGRTAALEVYRIGDVRG